MKLPCIEVAKFFAAMRVVQFACEYHYTRALAQVHTANDPVPRLATNHTNIAANKVLCHIRKLGLAHYTKRESTSQTLHRAATQRLYAPGGAHRMLPLLCNCALNYVQSREYETVGDANPKYIVYCHCICYPLWEKGTVGNFPSMSGVWYGSLA